MRLHKKVKKTELQSVIKKHFLGKIFQTPPKKSRVKRAERQREIYSFKILEKKEKDVLFHVSCEAGTYIRKLIHDFGEKLKIGAHMLELRRTKAGLFDESKSTTLFDLAKAVEESKKGKDSLLRKILLPSKIITKDLQKIEVKESSLERLSHGSPIFKKDLAKRKKIKKGDAIAVFCKGKLIEVARVVLDGDVVAKAETVLI